MNSVFSSQIMTNVNKKKYVHLAWSSFQYLGTFPSPSSPYKQRRACEFLYIEINSIYKYPLFAI